MSSSQAPYGSSSNTPAHTQTPSSPSGFSQSVALTGSLTFGLDPSFNYNQWTFPTPAFESTGNTLPDTPTSLQVSAEGPAHGPLSSPTPISENLGVLEPLQYGPPQCYQTRSRYPHQQHTPTFTRPPVAPLPATVQPPAPMSPSLPVIESQSAQPDEPQSSQPKKRKQRGGAHSSGASSGGTSASAQPALATAQPVPTPPQSPPASTLPMSSSTTTTTRVPQLAPVMQTSQRQRRGGRRQGVLNFSKQDVTELLHLIRQHMPAGQNGWQKVVTSYNAYASTQGRPKRDVISLRGKYYKLVNAKKPTGDPDCPPEVCEAKRIERAIQERVCLGIINDDLPIPEDWNVAASGSEVDDDAILAAESSTDVNEGDAGVLEGDSQERPAKRLNIEETKADFGVRVVFWLRLRITLIPRSVLNETLHVISPVFSVSRF
ncbi:hypothetical protein BN946_scf185000.g76 [Trametes cinnabarina]|uniref:DUF6818 domain-containing protein n=1 Tax=Pycnoporus cinnabarinus TaxID=5643 RepID=A0A060S963_PYCCI|nr:hypothetical protein BN946_scf185000.g76 [Trametes cinnabarina]